MIKSICGWNLPKGLIRFCYHVNFHLNLNGANGCKLHSAFAITEINSRQQNILVDNLIGARSLAKVRK